jgi:hypothetical protein
MIHMWLVYMCLVSYPILSSGIGRIVLLSIGVSVKLLNVCGSFQNLDTNAFEMSFFIFVLYIQESRKGSQLSIIFYVSSLRIKLICFSQYVKTLPGVRISINYF